MVTGNVCSSGSALSTTCDVKKEDDALEYMLLADMECTSGYACIPATYIFISNNGTDSNDDDEESKEHEAKAVVTARHGDGGGLCGQTIELLPISKFVSNS